MNASVHINKFQRNLIMDFQVLGWIYAGDQARNSHHANVQIKIEETSCSIFTQVFCFEHASVRFNRAMYVGVQDVTLNFQSKKLNASVQGAQNSDGKLFIELGQK